VTIWERVYTALSGLGWTLAENQMLVASGSQLPDDFLVYQLISSTPEEHADDVEKLRTWQVQVSAYSRSGLAGLPAIATAMTAAGFLRGNERELPYDQVTRHYGLAMEFRYYE
jgi:hypothetical protein